MAKSSGLGAAFYVDGVDLSGDTNQLGDISKSIGLEEMTGIDKYAIERLGTLLDGNLKWTAYFNPTGAHPVLANIPRTDRIASYWHKNNVLGTPCASMVVKQSDYAPSRDNSGKLTIDVEASANAWGLDWGLSLTTGKRTDAAATNGTGVDFQGTGQWDATKAFGLQAYLHVFAFTGTNATVKLQSSSDNGVGDAWADVVGGGFSVVSSAPQSQRIGTARNLAVERYLRVVTTGTFTNLVFAVSATVNKSDMTI